MKLEQVKKMLRTDVSRAPHGARGLKRRVEHRQVCGVWSRPARGAWIETEKITEARMSPRVAPRTGRVD